MDEPEAPDLLALAILAILTSADRPLTAEEVAAELGRLALEGHRIALGAAGERGH